MKKRILSLALVLMLLNGTASAAVLTLAPATPTQDRAVTLTSHWADGNQTVYDLHELSCDQETMEQAKSVYDFVYEQGQTPVRWYPEETQEAIEEMIDVDPDSLHMTEFMRLYAEEAETVSTLNAAMNLSIEYQPGQVTVVVLGDKSDPDNIVWTPVESKVTETGQVEFVITEDLMEQYQGGELYLTLLTVQQEPSDVTVVVETTEIPSDQPSISASSTIKIVKTISKTGEVLKDDFDLIVVQETDVIKQEMERIGQFVSEKSIMEWLPEDDRNRIRYLVGDVCDNLIVSDYVALTTENFHPTDGDAVGSLSFATPYKEGQTVITVLGTPRKDVDTSSGETLMDWSVQPTTVREGGVLDMVFNQLSLIDMGAQTGLLLVLTEPMPEETTEETTTQAE